MAVFFQICQRIFHKEEVLLPLQLFPVVRFYKLLMDNLTTFSTHFDAVIKLNRFLCKNASFSNISPPPSSGTACVLVWRQRSALVFGVSQQCDSAGIGPQCS